jgi:hypothetical protein
VSVSDGRGDVLECTASLPATVNVYPASFSLTEEPVRLDATLSDFPAPLHDPRVEVHGNKRRSASLDGEIAVRGTTEEPSGRVTAQLSFPAWKKLSKYILHCDARLAHESGEAPGIQSTDPRNAPSIPKSPTKPGTPGVEPVAPGLERGSLPLEPGAPGLTAAFSLTGPDGDVLAGSLSYPLLFIPFMQRGPQKIQMWTAALPRRISKSL